MNKTKYLHNINSPDDVKNLTFNELDILSDEIRDYIHEVISKLGGHYSSPLGVIDLTLALNYVYNTPDDKIIWVCGYRIDDSVKINSNTKNIIRINRKFNKSFY